MSNKVSLSVAVDSEEHDEIRGVVLDRLRRFNRQRAEPPDFRPLSVAARVGDEIVGGLVGETGWKWLYVDLLWVEDSRRNGGVGSELLRAAEEEAVRRGARHAYLDTFDFQARPFYERRGYTIFGTLNDYPPGHQRYFLRKDLVAPGRPVDVHSYDRIKS